jgi:hypothetical protein
VLPLPEAPDAGNAYPLLKAPRHVDRMPGLCHGSRREAGQTGGEILLAHFYHKEEE